MLTERRGGARGGKKKERESEREGTGRILSWKPCRAFLYLGITNTSGTERSLAPSRRTTFDFLRSWPKKGPADQASGGFGRPRGRERGEEETRGNRRVASRSLAFPSAPAPAPGKGHEKRPENRLVRLTGFRARRKRPSSDGRDSHGGVGGPTDGNTEIISRTSRASPPLGRGTEAGLYFTAGYRS